MFNVGFDVIIAVEGLLVFIVNWNLIIFTFLFIIIFMFTFILTFIDECIIVEDQLYRILSHYLNFFSSG